MKKTGRIIGLLIAILFLAYGLIRIGVGVALLAQLMGIVDFTELATAISEIRVFIDARVSEQIFPFSVAAYCAYILAMGAMLAGGAAAAITRKRRGHILLGIYLAMHAALFINFQEINPKIIGLILTAAMLTALVYLRPAKSLVSARHVTSVSN